MKKVKWFFIFLVLLSARFVFATQGPGTIVNWSKSNILAGGTWGLGVAPDGNIFCLSETGTLWRSTNNGDLWEAVAYLPHTNVFNLSFDFTGNIYILGLKA